MACPTTKLHSSEARNDATAATSRGKPRRPSSVGHSSRSRGSSSACGSTGPGAIALTTMPRGVRSTAMLRVSETSPPFDAAYAALPGSGIQACTPDVDDPAPAAPGHVGNDRLRQEERRREIACQHLLPGDEVDVCEGAAPAIETSIVDQ